MDKLVDKQLDKHVSKRLPSLEHPTSGRLVDTAVAGQVVSVQNTVSVK